jgi:hypothetical protein
MDHPAEEMLRRFGKGEGSPAENQEVVAHLLRGCKVCSEIVRKAIQPETPPPEDKLPNRLMILRRATYQD